ncbi:MAG: hypothetical protein HETSPECPRED_008104 [Heterodermia speciosa]|uniref:Uncharacterized protein n=1 Tax=Heterodermia speciosa TaxID=116794 RepID=A0A8H3EMB0_9LECA|nr:MAG: hypothetical protein HETSPECPRED_008104 [Heterodermia speciosa]
MRRSFLLTAAIGWTVSLATATQSGIDGDGGIILDQSLSETPAIQSLTENSTTSSLEKRPGNQTLPKIAQMHAPKSELQALFNSTSSFSAVPQINEIHQSKGALIIPRPTAVLQPGLQAVGMIDPGLSTTPITTSVAVITKGPSTTPVASNLSTPVNSLAAAAAAAENHSLRTNGLQGGLGALGQMTGTQYTTPTSTKESVLMSGFVYKGTSYPPLTLAIMSSAEQHSSQTILNPQTTAYSLEEHTSQTNLIATSHQPNVQPTTTTPTASLLKTTTPTPNQGSDNTDTIISAFTFQGTAYPAISLVPESAAAGYQSSQPASANPITTSTQPASSQPASSQPIPTTTTTSTPTPGISISNHPLPTTFGNIAGPSSSSPSISISTPQNPTGIPLLPTTPPFIALTNPLGGLQSFSTSKLYAVTTDANGYVSLRPQRPALVPSSGVTAVVWGGGYINGTSGGGNRTTAGVGGGNRTTAGVGGGNRTTAGVGGGNRTTAGVVPFLSRGRKGRGLGGWWWCWWLLFLLSSAGAVSLGLV